jgi:regulator of CtrA degradation
LLQVFPDAGEVDVSTLSGPGWEFLRMSRQFDGWKHLAAASNLPPGAVSFVHRLTASPAFTGLFREGMALVEEAAAYLDGPGREESKALARPAALAYATESMRLTTRLMQVASWLLLQRAVNEGELTPNQALTERHRVKLARQGLACDPDIFDQLPASLRALSRRSLRIQERVIHLDQSLVSARAPEASGNASGVAEQHERLRAAFSN